MTTGASTPIPSSCVSRHKRSNGKPSSVAHRRSSPRCCAGIAVMTTPPEAQVTARSSASNSPARRSSNLPDGDPRHGAVWCSPVALTMVLQYWHAQQNDERLAPFLVSLRHRTLDRTGRPRPGLWWHWGTSPFNTAFAASLGLEAYVARFDTLRELATWTAAGIPVIASISWEPGTLDNAVIAQSSGHLVVVAGFTPTGDVIVNDPAGTPAAGGAVRRIYRGDQFRAAWHRKGHGTVYLIYPPGLA